MLLFRKIYDLFVLGANCASTPILFWGLGVPCNRVLAMDTVNSDHTHIGSI